MMLKALPLVQFWSILLLKEQMMTSVRKTVKMLVWSAQNRANKVFPKITTKSFFFLPIDFRLSLPQKFPQNQSIFLRICPKKSHEIRLFSATYKKPCIVWCDPSDLKISWIEVGIHLEVNWLCLCDLAHFLLWKQGRIGWNVCFNFTLLI